MASDLDPVFPHMELWTALRTAYLDAKVARHTSAPWSFRQVVLLGAGLDTRAARLSQGEVAFFEVDHPQTQAEKRRRLEGIEGYFAPRVRYIPCDFEHDDVARCLLQGGLDVASPALVLWEGVVPYLRENAVRGTLRVLADRLHPKSIVVFDHLHKPREKTPEQLAAETPNARGFVDRLGEPILFVTNDPLPMLYEEGFRHVRSVSFDEICLTLTGSYVRERQFRFQRIVTASVTPPPDLD